MRIILASKSPRRKKLLASVFPQFDIIIPDINEDFDNSISPYQNVMNVAEKKADVVYAENTDAIVIAADTTVYMSGIGYFNKPENKAVAKKYLMQLTGETHIVYTGVCMIFKGKKLLFYDKSLVTLKLMSEDEIEKYIEDYNPLDKAGAYGFQDGVCACVSGYESTVIGLPVELLKEKIKLFKEL